MTILIQTYHNWFLFQGGLFVGIWIMFPYLFIQLFNMEIRSGLIRQEFEKSITSIDQIDFLTTPAFCNNKFEKHDPLIVILNFLLPVIPRMALSIDLKFPMEYFHREDQNLTSFSAIIQKDIHPTLATNFDNDFCSTKTTFNQLLYLQSKPESVLVIWPDCLRKLIVYYKKQDIKFPGWYWKVHDRMHQTMEKEMIFGTIMFDNSLQWKEEIFRAFEEQKASGLLHYDNSLYRHLSQSFGLSKNPYRIDQNGFEGTKLNVKHLYQAFMLCLLGMIGSIWAILVENQTYIGCIRHLGTKRQGKKRHKVKQQR